MNIKTLYKFTIVLAFIFVFPTAVAIALEKVPPPETCTPTTLSGASMGVTIGVARDENGDWPVPSTCTEAGISVPCWKYLYTTTSNFANWSQTAPGYGWTPRFKIYTADSFSSIVFSPPPNGSTVNDKLYWGQGIYEISVIDFKAAWPGEPTKFGYAANQSGVGWTSMKFKSGNTLGYCAIAGPDYEQLRIIKPVVKWVLYYKTRIRFEINYEECTFKAFQETDADGVLLPEEIELEQHPISEISLSINGTPIGLTKEINSPGKCDEQSFANGDNSCITTLFSGRYITYCR